MTLFGQVPGTDFEEMETTPVFTKTLAEMAVTPASELMVREAHRSCWPKLWIRKMRLWIAFASGAILVINLTAVYIIHATLQNLDSRTEEIVARTVEKLLQEQRISLPRKASAQMSGGTGYNQGDVP